MAKLIEISDKYALKHTPSAWELHEYGTGKDSNGKPRRTDRPTWHATLDQACTAIIDREAGNCFTVAELKDFFLNAVERLTAYVKKEVDDEIS